MKRILLTLFLFACCSQLSWAQPLIGTYNLPVPRFLTLDTILKYMNDSGVSGPVIINLSRDENAPSGGYVMGSSVLNSGPLSTDLARQVTINGNGHVLTAPSGTGSTDAIFKLVGTDWVTINGIHLVEAAANTTATSRMEWGFALLKRSVNDGVQNSTIQNCKISLSNANTTPASGVSPVGSTGIFIGHCLRNNTAILGAPDNDTGAHRSIFIFRDTIANVNHGIYGYGARLTVDGVNFNDNGLTIMENRVLNFSHDGVALAFFNNDQVLSNYINNMDADGTAPTDHNLSGISYTGDASLTGNNNWTCSKNVIDLTSATNGTFETYGVYTGINGSGTTTISEDSIKLTATGPSSGLIGIYSQNDQGTQTISKNYIHDFTTTTTNNQRVAAIYNGYTATWALGYPGYNYPTSSVIDGNLMEGFSVYSGTSDNIAILHVVSDVNLTPNPTTFTNNTMNDIAVKSNSLRFFGYGSTYLYAGTMVQSATITGNTFTKFSSEGTSTPMYVMWPRAAYNGRSAVVKKNSFSNIRGGTGLTIALALDYGAYNEVSRDTINQVTGEGVVAGIYAGSSDYALTTMQIDHNQVSNVMTSGAAGTAAGIQVGPGNVNVTTSALIFSNTIHGVWGGGINATIRGLYISGGSLSTDIHNNMLSDITASNNTTAYSSCFGMQLQSAGVNQVQYNTIFMISGGAGGSGFGATGLSLNPAGSNTVQNNIFNVDITPATGTNVAAVRMSGGTATAAPGTSVFSASNNIYYAPPVNNSFLYVEGTNNIGLVNGYNISGLTTSADKNIVNDTFFNSHCDRSTYHNFMQQASKTREAGTFAENNLRGMGSSFVPFGTSYAESGAIDIPAIGVDITEALRTTGSSDIGAMEFNGTTLPTMNIDMVSGSGLTEACIYKLPKLTVRTPAYFARISYQWYQDKKEIPGATDSFIIADVVTADYTVAIYDSVTGCTDTSLPFTMTIVPPPPAMITYYDSLVFCETSAVVLNANKGKDYIYQWYKDGIPMAGETSDYIVADETGAYTIDINTPLGCPTLSTPIKVTVYPLPTPTIVLDMYGRLSTGKYYTYQWFEHNMEIPGANGQTYAPPTDGAYTVEVTDSNGCTNKTTVYLYTTDIPGTPMADLMHIYPNPSSGMLYIESPVAVSAVLTDVTGRTILEKASGVKEINLEGHAEGMYLLHLYQGTQLVKTEKIVKGR